MVKNQNCLELLSEQTLLYLIMCFQHFEYLSEKRTLSLIFEITLMFGFSLIL